MVAEALSHTEEAAGALQALAYSCDQHLRRYQLSNELDLDAQRRGVERQHPSRWSAVSATVACRQASDQVLSQTAVKERRALIAADATTADLSVDAAVSAFSAAATGLASEVVLTKVGVEIGNVATGSAPSYLAVARFVSECLSNDPQLPVGVIDGATNLVLRLMGHPFLVRLPESRHDVVAVLGAIDAAWAAVWRAADELLSSKAVERSKVHPADEICLVCLDEHPNVQLLCCSGFVHQACFARWCRRHDRCPQCRQQLASEAQRGTRRDQCTACVRNPVADRCQFQKCRVCCTGCSFHRAAGGRARQDVPERHADIERCGDGACVMQPAAGCTRGMCGRCCPRSGGCARHPCASLLTAATAPHRCRECGRRTSGMCGQGLCRGCCIATLTCCAHHSM
jgi:hypothetical protein